MPENIYLISGSKGGVGKSMVSVAAADCLLGQGKKVLVLDADEDSPDVAKICSGLAKTELVSLDGADGWVDMANMIYDAPGHAVVVNTAARNSAGMAACCAALADSLGALGMGMAVLWVINRQRDSLELLKKYLAAAAQSVRLHVVCNGFFGGLDRFGLYNGSNIKKHVEGRGGRTVLFPGLADRVADEICNARVPVSEGLKNMPLGNRAELLRWRKAAWAALGGLLDG